MKTLFKLIALSTLVALVSCSEKSYDEIINEQRLEKNEWLRTSIESPINDKAQFKGLKYFSPNEAFRVQAICSNISTPSTVELATSTSEPRAYSILGTLEFNIDNTQQSLTVFQLPNGKGEYFIPFLDETSALETYGSGRYLPLEKFEDGLTVDLDFNLCYNPYCAYNSDFSCPVPPSSNRLKIRIEAGEKSYH